MGWPDHSSPHRTCSWPAGSGRALASSPDLQALFFGKGGMQDRGMAAAWGFGKAREISPCKSSFKCLQGCEPHGHCAPHYVRAHMHSLSPLPHSHFWDPDFGLSCLPGQLAPSTERQLSSPPILSPGSPFLTSSPVAAETPPCFLPHLGPEEEGSKAPAARHQRELLTAFQTVGSNEKRARPVPNHHTSYALN